MLVNTLGRVEREQGEHNASGAESLGGAEKSQQCRKYFLQYTTFAPGGAKFVSCPGRHLPYLFDCKPRLIMFFSLFRAAYS